jgi:uncharacterized protein (TIGR00369 family)
MGVAAMSVQPGMAVVTTNLQVHYTAPSKGGCLVATATVVHTSKRTAVVEASVLDDAGVLCAWGSGSFLVTGGLSDAGAGREQRKEGGAT